MTPGVYILHLHIVRCMGSNFVWHSRNVTQNLDLIHYKRCFSLTYIFVFGLRYLWIMTSQALASETVPSWNAFKKELNNS